MEFETSWRKSDCGVCGTPMRDSGAVAVAAVVTSDHLEETLWGPRYAHAGCRGTLESSWAHLADQGGVRWIALAGRTSR